MIAVCETVLCYLTDRLTGRSISNVVFCVEWNVKSELNQSIITTWPICSLPTVKLFLRCSHILNVLMINRMLELIFVILAETLATNWHLVIVH